MSRCLAGVLLAAIIFLVCAGPAFAGSGLQVFLQSGMDGQNTNRSPFAAPDEPPKPAWAYQLETGWIPGSMVCGPDGTVYIVVFPLCRGLFDDTAKLLAIGTDGTRKWEIDCPTSHPLRAPAIDLDGNIYMHSTGAVISLYPDGRERWAYCSENGDFTGLSLIPGHGVLTGGRPAMVSPEGRVIWEMTGFYGGVAIASPDSIAFFGDGDRGHGLYILSMDGAVVRFAPTSSSFDVSVTPNGSFLLPALGGILECYSSAGERMWTWKSHDVIPPQPAVAANGDIYIYGLGQREIMCMTPERKIKWTTSFMGENLSRALVLPDCSILACGTLDRTRVFRIGPEGTMSWAVDLPEPIGEKSYVFCSPVVAPDGTIFVALQSGRIIALRQ